jgi:predicted Zn-dependent protease
MREALRARCRAWYSGIRTMCALRRPGLPPHSALGALGFALLLAAVACATSPTGRRQLIVLSDAEMDSMGLSAYEQLKRETPISRDASGTAYVRCVAAAITREASGPTSAQAWEVNLFEDATANAFALPGGKIGVNTGLLGVARSQDQLATVLGHEVGHVLARHGNERVSQNFAVQGGLFTAGALLGVLGDSGSSNQGLLLAALGLGAQVGVLLPYSRVQESEADEIGLGLMAQAGFDPRQSVELWKNMMRAGGARPPEFLSTHPDPENRIKRLYELMPGGLETQARARASGRAPSCTRGA